MSRNILSALFFILAAAFTLPASAGGAGDIAVPVETLPFSMEEGDLKSRATLPPSRFAEAFAHRISTAGNGRWRTEAKDGFVLAIWEYAARIPGAVSMSAHIDRITLAGGASLRVENTDGEGETFYEGSLAHRDDLWTETVPGDTLVFRLEVPAEHKDSVQMETRRFHGGFKRPENVMPRPMSQTETLPQTKRTSTTNPEDNNYSCFATAENANLSRATAYFTIQGISVCTGSLVNHPGSQTTPYLMSAAHCGDIAPENSDTENARSVVASFRKITQCGQPMSGVAPDNDSRRGVASVYRDPKSTFATDYWVIELENYPSTAVNPYLAGYDGDTERVIDENGRAVHHAQGRSQQWYIAPFESTETIDQLDSSGNPNRRSSYHKYKAPVGGGASGAGVYNDADRIVGVISASDSFFMYASSMRSAMQVSSLASVFGGVTSSPGRDAPAVSPPTVNASACCGIFESGEDITVRWSSSGATSCEARDDWSGPLALNGERTTKIFNNSGSRRSYDLTVACTNSQGLSASSTATVAVNTAVAEPPDITISVSPTSVETGETAQLSWQTDGAASCNASGDWSGAKPLNGSETVGPFASAGTYTFQLNCSNPDENASESASLTVVAPPAVDLVISSPSSAEQGETFAVTWNATNADSCTASGAWSGSKSVSGSQSFSYTTTGTRTYTLNCNGPGQAASKSTSTAVVAADPVTMTFTGPAQATTGENVTVQWSSQHADSCQAAGDWGGQKAVSGNETLSFASAGTKTLTLNCFGPGEDASQTINIQVTDPEPDAVLLTMNAPSSAQTGVPFSINWSTQNAKACNASGDWGGAKATSGSENVTANAAGTKTYGLTCTGDGESASQTVTVAVADPVPQPTASISAPSTVRTGESFDVTWSSNDAQSCAASGAWAGTRATSGSQSFRFETAGARTFTIACSNSSGSASDSIQVTVQQPNLPAVDVTAPSSANTGESFTVAWSSDRATACTASGAWSGSKASNGSQDFTFQTAGNRTFTLTCSNSDGSSTDTAQVSVQSPPPPEQPTVTLTAPSQVATGESFDVNWVSGQANSCSASGAWTGGKDTSGTQTFRFDSPGTRTFTIICSNANGTASDSKQVSVLSPGLPTVNMTAPTTAFTGQSFTVTWSSDKADACSASGAWSGAKPGQGSQSFSFNSPGNREFVLSCSNADGETTASRSVQIATPPAVALNLSGPATAAAGESFMIDWASSNADSCVASGAWSGNKPTEGSQRFSYAEAGSRTFTLECNGQGQPDTKSVTVDVLAPPPAQPVLALQGPSLVATGAEYTITYETSNVTSCVASGDWSGQKGTSGSEKFTDFAPGTRTYSLECSGPGGTTSDTVTVAVQDSSSSMQLTFSATPESIRVGEVAVLAWDSNGTASHCETSGAWSGRRLASGSVEVQPFEPGEYQYIMRCVSGESAIQRSATVTVEPSKEIDVVLTATPDEVAVGEPFTLQWNANGAEECSKTGAWEDDASDPTPTSGSQTITPVTSGNRAYTLRCGNADGDSDVASVLVFVGASGDGGGSQGGSGINQGNGGGSFGIVFLAFSGILLMARRRFARGY